MILACLSGLSQLWDLLTLSSKFCTHRRCNICTGSCDVGFDVAVRGVSSMLCYHFLQTTQIHLPPADSRQKCGTQMVCTCSHCYYHAGPSRTEILIALSVYNDGRVCISILHSPGDDPHGYETASERWSPVQSVRLPLENIAGLGNAVHARARRCV